MPETNVFNPCSPRYDAGTFLDHWISFDWLLFVTSQMTSSVTRICSSSKLESSEHWVQLLQMPIWNLIPQLYTGNRVLELEPSCTIDREPYGAATAV